MTENKGNIEVNEEEKTWHHVVNVEDLGGLKKKINIIYDSVAVGMAFDKSCDIVSKQVQVKGFRKGKAPKQLVERAFSDKIKEIASSLLSQEGFLHGCYENKISPLSEPKVEDAEFNMDGTFSCNIYLDIKPVITPSGYVGLKLEKPNVNVENICDNMLENLKYQHTVFVPKEEVQEGHRVTLDFCALVDGKEVSSGKDHQFIIKKGQEPPFGENLLGVKVGEMVSEKIIMPEHIPDTGGKEAEVKLEVKLSCESCVPTDEELVEKMQAPSYDDLMNLIKRSAKNEEEKQQRKVLEEQVVDKLLKMHEFDVPENWVDDEEKYLSNQLSLKDPDEEMLKTIREMAKRNVARTFMFEAIYDEEKSLAITKEELDSVLEEEANRMGIGKLALKNDLKNKGMMDGIIGMIKHKKVMDLILSQAQYENVETQVNDAVLEQVNDVQIQQDVEEKQGE